MKYYCCVVLLLIFSSFSLASPSNDSFYCDACFNGSCLEGNVSNTFSCFNSSLTFEEELEVLDDVGDDDSVSSEVINPAFLSRLLSWFSRFFS